MATPLETPFRSIVVVPLESISASDLSDAWIPGPLPMGDDDPREEYRLAFYADPRPAEELLRPDRRWWCVPPRSATRQLVIVHAELLQHDPSWSSIGAHLVLHVETTDTATASSAPTELADLVRPGTALFRQLVAARLPDWELLYVTDVRRAASLSLSAAPEAHETGLIRWPGQEPVVGRMVDLVVLRKNRVNVSMPFPLVTEQPTPSHALAASGHSMAVVRLRPVANQHVARLRTSWLDAYLLELLRYEEVQGVAAAIKDLSLTNDQRRWQSLGEAFRRFRSTNLWDAGSDHPMEAAIARRLRAELGTDELIARIQSEIEDHTDALQTAATNRLEVAVLALTFATVILPMLPQVVRGDGDVASALTLLVAVGLFACLVLWMRSGVRGGRRMRGSEGDAGGHRER